MTGKKIVTFLAAGIAFCLIFVVSCKALAATKAATKEKKERTEELKIVTHDRDAESLMSKLSKGSSEKQTTVKSQTSSKSQSDNKSQTGSKSTTKEKNSKKNKNSYTQSELRYMTCIIYCEARGECDAGKKAVGIVVMNRVRDDEFPNNIKDVIYQRGQFTPVYNGSLNKALSLYDEQKKNGKITGSMKKCMKAAKSALGGSTTVKVNGKKKQMKKYLYFSQYIPNAKYQLGGHQFK